jgi:hypothetical protein
LNGVLVVVVEVEQNEMVMVEKKDEVVVSQLGKGGDWCVEVVLLVVEVVVVAV